VGVVVSKLFLFSYIGDFSRNYFIPRLVIAMDKKTNGLLELEKPRW